MVSYFKYLGRVISAADNECPAVVGNLEKSRAFWQRLTGIFSREGASPWVSGFFLKAMVQSVQIFGAEIWVVTSRMDQIRGGGSRTRWHNS